MTLELNITFFFLWLFIFKPILIPSLFRSFSINSNSSANYEISVISDLSSDICHFNLLPFILSSFFWNMLWRHTIHFLDEIISPSFMPSQIFVLFVTLYQSDYCRTIFIYIYFLILHIFWLIPLILDWIKNCLMFH